jgi:hypothetical protein
VFIYSYNNSNGFFSKWEKAQYWVQQGSFLGTLFLLIYVNDLSKSVSDKSSTILFADDTSCIVANRNEFNTNEIFTEINKWFHSNL